jgi:hypothetical protein
MIETIKIIIDEKPYLFNVKNRPILRLSDINKLIKRNPNNYFLTVSYKGEKILTDEILKSIFDRENDIIELQIKLNNKLKGGFGIAMFAILIFPMIFIGTAFARLGEVLDKFFKIIGDIINIIPLIFDPPKLMNDILFATTFGINSVFKTVTTSIKDGSKTPEDETAERGVWGVDKSAPQKCLDPTFSTIILLIICPPLAILYKLGFMPGLVSSIICGVLCVKLYYFPGLLFAILHVLC